MGNFIWPCPGYSRVTCGWGTPRSYGHHLGVDIGVPTGSRLIATRAGRVLSAGYKGSYGIQVYIDHGNGVKSRCAHCSQALVKAGQRVSAGQIIAKSGNTGHSTGPHLHFEIWINGRDRNPLQYVGKSDTLSRFTGKRGSSSLKLPEMKKQDATKEITTVKVKSTRGKTAFHSGNSLQAKKTGNRDRYELLIQHNGKVYQPMVEDGITVTWERKGTPGKMEFTVYNDKLLQVYKGDAVRFKAGDRGIFFGYVFTVRHVRRNWMTVTCYDQLRYFTNQDVMSYKNKTYSQLLRLIAKQYRLNLGTVENTKYVISKRMEEGTLFDILGNASDLTYKNTNESYVLYDNFGKICLRRRSNLKVPIIIDADMAESYDYESSIDGNVYNRIKLYIDNEKTGIREVYIYNNPDLQKKWGILQMTQKSSAESASAAQKQAGKLGQQYDRIRRRLSFKNCFGDTRVRAGSLIKVELSLIDKKQSGYMIVERVTHMFGESGHTMDLEMLNVSGGFYA